MTYAKHVIIFLASSIMAGCNAGMIININLSDLYNSGSNGKVLTGKMILELSGRCIDATTGSESESLVDADGIMYNLFNQHQKRISCTPKDKYGFSSVAEYSFDVLLDTIKDNKSPSEGFPIQLAAIERAVYLQADQTFINRLKAKMNSTIPINYSIYININNPKRIPIDVYAPSSYLWVPDKNRYIPLQQLSEKGLKTSLGFKLGSVSIDNLLEQGGTYVVGITKQ